MRALSLEETEHLRGSRWTAEPLPRSHPDFEIAERLRRRGLLIVRRTAHNTDEYVPTDLGHLALRVALPFPEVTGER